MLAVAGLVVVVALVAIVLALTKDSDNGNDTTTGPTAARATMTTAPPVDPAVDLPTGTCFDAGPPQVGAPLPLDAIVTVPCTQPHHYEVFATAEHPAARGADYPGAEILYETASDTCIGLFLPALGMDFEHSGYDVASTQPDEESWDDGDRHITCAVVRTDYDVLSVDVFVIPPTSAP
jgi:hypothetical protein